METETLRRQDEQQLIVFDLSTQAYGVDIGDVREILRLQEITKAPRTPALVEGIVNLRGRVVPVIDLRKRLELPTAGETRDNRVVVVNIGGRDVGVIVDAVTEVLRISTASVEPPSSVVTTAESEYLTGVAKLDDRLIAILDLDRVLSESELVSLEKCAVQAA